MTQEEKAKAYDEVRKKIAIRFGSNVADEFFAEFEESEDERIRKGLIKGFNECIKDAAKNYSPNMIKYWHGIEVDSILAWLEKQGEKKPEENKGNIGGISSNSKWSEEDEQHIDSLLKRLDALCRNKFERTRFFAISEDRGWLKSIKQRIQKGE